MSNALYRILAKKYINNNIVVKITQFTLIYVCATGFTVTDRGCCGTGLLESSILCNQITPTCDADSQFVFWDSLHPCEAVYQRTAKYPESKDCFPFIPMIIASKSILSE